MSQRMRRHKYLVPTVIDSAANRRSEDFFDCIQRPEVKQLRDWLCSSAIERMRMHRRGKCSQEAGELVSFKIGILQP